MATPQNYLEGAALLAAVEWLVSRGLPEAQETAEEMIAVHYPGGLHFFIAEHLVAPPQQDEPESACHEPEFFQETLF